MQVACGNDNNSIISRALVIQRMDNAFARDKSIEWCMLSFIHWLVLSTHSTIEGNGLLVARLCKENYKI